jgi:hypothetical protein
MKTTFLLLTTFLSFSNLNAQMVMYQCKNIVQRDSISNDLISKGYTKKSYENDGLYIWIPSDDWKFCFVKSTSLNKVLSLQEFYSYIVEYTKPVLSLNDYLHKIDKFTGEKIYYGRNNTVSFSKYVTSKSSIQYVKIILNGSALNYGCYGVKMLFENGKKIIRSKEKIDTDYSENGWSYTAFFTPTANEIALLKTQKISAVQLYIYDADISENEGNDILDDAKILLTSPKKK